MMTARSTLESLIDVLTFYQDVVEILGQSNRKETGTDNEHFGYVGHVDRSVICC